MILHFVDNALAHSGSRSFFQTTNSKHQPFVSEVVFVLISCFRNAVAEDEEPVAGEKVDRLLNRGQNGQYARWWGHTPQPDAGSLPNQDRRIMSGIRKRQSLSRSIIDSVEHR